MNGTLIATIDGNTNPSAIPDDVAFFHLFKTLARDSSLTPAADQQRRLAYVKYFFKPNCGLNNSENLTLTDQQSQFLLLTAENLMQTFLTIESTAVLASAAPPDAQKQKALQTALTLLSSTDPDAFAKIRSHVLDHVKRRIQLVNIGMPVPARTP